MGKIVAKHPYVVDVLNKYKIDYTFRGDRTLEEAISEKGLSEYDVVGEMDLAVDEYKLMNSQVVYWENEPIDKILDFIEGHHHIFMKKTLAKIASVLDGKSDDISVELIDLFFKLKSEMEAHQENEEKKLFSLLREYTTSRSADLRHTIVKFMIETEEEHDNAGRIFKTINGLTNDFTPPSDASKPLKKVYKLLNALEKDTFMHIHMENSILFKMI